MPRITIRVPDEMKERMDLQGETNWSEYVRKRIREKLEHPKATQKIENLVENYKSDLPKLWTLHMFATHLPENHIYETANLLFGEDADLIVDNVKTDLEMAGLPDMHRRLESDFQVGGKIRKVITLNGLNKIKKKTREFINDSSEKTRDGIYLLSLFLRNKLDKKQAKVSSKGFQRTWEIYSEDEINSKELIKTGIMYKNYVIPGYSLDLLSKISKEDNSLEMDRHDPSESEIQRLVEEERVVEFLGWLNGTTKYVDFYKEEKSIEKELEEKNLDLTLDEFKETRDELIKKKLLVIKRNPQKNTSQPRNDKPAKWEYELTQPVINSVPLLNWRPSSYRNLIKES